MGNERGRLDASYSEALLYFKVDFGAQQGIMLCR